MDFRWDIHLVLDSIVFKGKKGAGLFAGLDEKQYPFKDLYFIGYEFLEMIGYDYKTKNDRIMRKQMAVLNDCRYADYYIRVTRSQKGDDRTYIICSIVFNVRTVG